MDKKTAFQHGFLCKLAELDLTPDQIFDAVSLRSDYEKSLMKAAQATPSAWALGAGAANKAVDWMAGGFGRVADVIGSIAGDYTVPALVLGPTLAGAGLGVLASKMSSTDKRDIERLKKLQLLREYRRANEILMGFRAKATGL